MSYIRSKVRFLVLAILSIGASLTVGAAVVAAATTISTNIQTDGTLSVTGASTLTGLVTMSGAATVGTTLNVTGATTLSTVEVTGAVTLDSSASVGTSLTVGTTASTSKLIVGGDSADGTISGIVTGYCNIAAVGSFNASTTQAVTCANATGLRAGDRVFVQATSSLQTNFIIQYASTTAAGGAITVGILNDGIGTAVNSMTATSLNFWAVR